MAVFPVNLHHVLLLTCMLPALTYTLSYLDEQELKKKLLNNYDNEIRSYPSFGILMNFVLFSLNKLSVEDQEMSVTAVMYTRWYDGRLMWNASEHAGIESIMLHHGRIWQPRLMVENSVDQIRGLGDEEKGPLRVYSDGEVKWMIPAVIKVFCVVEIVAFPFDRQDCTINIYTWGYDITEIYLLFPETSTLTFFKKNGEWDLIEANQYYANDTDNDEVYQKMKINLKMRRKWLFLCMTMLVPAVLNSVLMGAVFALPYESGEKMSYSLTVLLTYIVLLTLVADSLPPISTEISALQIYLSSVMCMGTIATLLTVWTVSIHNRNPEKPRPFWLVFFALKVSRYLLCKEFELEFSTPKKRSSRSRCGDKSRKYDNNGGSEDTSSTPHERQGYQNERWAFQIERACGVIGRIPRSIVTPYKVSTTDLNSQPFSETSSRPNSSGFGSEGRDSRSPMGQNHEDVSLGELGSSKSSHDDEIDPQCVTWVQIANIMDCLFLRVVSSIILLGTVGLIIYLAINY